MGGGYGLRMTPQSQRNLCDILAHPGAFQKYLRKETNQSPAFLLPWLGVGRRNHYLSIKGHDDLGRLGTVGIFGFHRWHKVGEERKFQTYEMHSGEYFCVALGISFLKPHFA